MLYRLIIENFRSFRNRTELSLIPNKNSVHSAYTDTDYPVLRDVAIYGPNASGKSNIIKAMDFLRKVILDPSVLPVAKNQSFKLATTTLDAPSLFVVEIRVDNCIYQYGLVLHFKSSTIVSEWLKRFDQQQKQWSSVFSRQNTEAGLDEIQFSVSVDNPNYSRYNIYRQDLSTQHQRLILSEIANKDLSGDSCTQAINAVYSWFDDLQIIFPNTTFNLLGALIKDLDGVNSLYKSYFKRFDIDIESINLKDIPENTVLFPERLEANIKRDLIASNGKKSFAVIHGPKDYIARLNDNGDITYSEITFIHRLDDYEADFELREESDGTQRLFDLIPMIARLIDENKVVMIDELDRSLHCLLTRKMLQLVLDEADANSRSQIILTTHDVLLMDLDILGRKEIWFVNKKKKVSTLYPLDKFKFEDNINISNNYLLGRFKAIPEY